MRPRSGRITLGDRVLFDRAARVDLPPEARGVGYVFQEYALFPHMSIGANVAFGGGRRAGELMERLGIAHLARARPHDVSGGERQRAALARALARDPGVLLLDEPLAALDAHTRDRVRGELAALLAELGLPVLLVTHDLEDATALADRIAVVASGRIRWTGTPAELLTRPDDAFAARFAGANVLAGVAGAGAVGGREVVLDGGGVIRAEAGPMGPVDVVIHPWHLQVVPAAGADPAANRIRATVASVQPRGDRARVRVGPLVAEIPAAEGARLRPGSPADVVWSPRDTLLLARRT